jgi:cytochrome b561
METKGYSLRQIGLHWLVFGLVAYQWFTGDNMTELFRAAHGGRPTEIAPAWGTAHIAIGVVVLLLMIWRLGLRHTDGSPAPAKQHPALQWLSGAVHVALYLDFILGSLVGLAAYFFLPKLAGLHDLMMRQIFLVLFALHVVGVLWHRFILRDDVMARMIRPAR